MKSEKLSTEIAALERKVKDAKNETVKKLLNKKLSSLKDELKKEDDGLSKLSKAKKKIREMSEKDFNEFIKNLSKKEGFAFLKSMTKDEIKRDIQRVAKPVGWRFRGDNTKKPTRKDIKEGNNVYWEGRRNRSDVSRAVKLETGGTAASSETGEFIGGENASSMYKDGGNIDYDYQIYNPEAIKLIIKHSGLTKKDYDSLSAETKIILFKNAISDLEKEGFYKDGGEIEEEKKYIWEHRHTKGITAEILDTTSKGFKVKQTEEYEAWGDKKLSKPKVKTAFYSKKEFLDLFKIKGLKYEQKGGLSDMPESFPDNDAMSYAKGGSLFDEPHRSEMKGMMARGGAASNFKYEIYAENTNTGEKSIVALVKAYGDIPLMITGLKMGVKTSPIKYGFKQIK